MENIKELENIRKEALKEIFERYFKAFQEIETKEGLDKYLKWEGKIYKSNPKEKLLRYLMNRKHKEILKLNAKIDEISQAKDDLPNPLIITIEWVKSRTWGSNPHASDNYGHESESISGCGYDKESTATAQILNQNLTILKALYLKKDECLRLGFDVGTQGDEMGKKLDQNPINRRYLGYGSGYGVLPKFEGGVGVDSHRRILESVGYEMKHISNTKHTDVYIIQKKGGY